ncbi:MAG TPA: flippase, partial [Candidatus Moranbacteria bacterium]|nr:flippase [Candidatus Moranbacteria bacterium]
NIISLRVLSSLAVFLLALVIIKFLPYPQEVQKGILIAAAAFVFSSGYMVLNGIFQKNLVMYKVATVEFVGKIIQTGFIIMAVIMDWGFMAIIIALLIYMVFNFVIVFFLSRRYVKFSPEIDFSYWRKFLKESMPMGISVFITFLYFKLDTIMLSVIKTNADVGIYSAAYKIIENITFFPAMIAGLVLPLISRHIFSNKDKFEDISNKTFKVFFLLVVPLIVGTMFLSEGVINLIGGAGFEESANVLRVLVFALAFIFFGHFFNNILLVGNLQKKLMVALAFCAVFNITANLILIPRYSYAGAAITSVFTEMLVVSLTFYLVLKYLKYRPKIQHGVRILFSGLVMAAFLFVFKDMNFFILAFGSAGVYSLFLWLTKTISSEEILSIVARRT